MLEFTDRFVNISVFTPNIAQFIAEITSNMQTPEADIFIEAFSNIEVSNIKIDGTNKTWGEYLNKTWGEVNTLTWNDL